MTIEVSGIYNRVDRLLLLDETEITGSQEMRDYLAAQTATEVRAHPVRHVEVICEVLRPLFGDTLWRSDSVPVGDVSAEMAEPSAIDVFAESEAPQSAVAAEVAEAKPSMASTPRRRRR